MVTRRNNYFTARYDENAFLCCNVDFLLYGNPKKKKGPIFLNLKNTTEKLDLENIPKEWPEFLKIHIGYILEKINFSEVTKDNASLRDLYYRVYDRKGANYDTDILSHIIGIEHTKECGIIPEEKRINLSLFVKKNKEILEKWDFDEELYRDELINFLNKISENEKEQNRFGNKNNLMIIIKHIQQQLNLGTMDGYAVALSWILLSCILGKKIMEIYDAYVVSNEVVNIQSSFRKKIMNKKKNIWFSSKENTENVNEFPFEKKMAGIRRMTLVNYAGTSFISGIDIASVYETSDKYKKWFSRSLVEGKIEANVILTDMHSYAALDAEKYKMYPKGQKKNTDMIISDNINKLLDLKKQHLCVDLSIYLTDICLPYGLMIAEGYNSEDSYIKVDLYAPVVKDDRYRPSFYIFNSDPDTKSIYDFFFKNALDIQAHSKKIEKTKDISWIIDKPIIHRGKLFSKIPEHSLSGYWECIKNGFPMEIDLLFIKRNEIIVGRDEEMISKNDKENNFEFVFSLSEKNIKELRGMHSDDYITRKGDPLSFKIEELMTFEELLNLVNGSVPLLIEVKCNEKMDELELEHIAKKVVKTIKFYNGKYAIHASNPWVLKKIREIDNTIPLGQISWSFDGTGVSKQYQNIHQKNGYLDIIEPDFISYKIEELKYDSNKAKEIRDICRDRKIPLLAWTIKNKTDERIARKLCDNIIIEGASTFI